MRTPAARADTRFTYDDFVLFPDDGKRHEIIDGEHYVTAGAEPPAPAAGRAAPSRDRQLYLGRTRTPGRVFLSPLDVVLSYYDVVEPDLLFVAGDQAAILTEKNVQGPPALVVEVLSKSTRKRDAQIKRRLFERTGVREYWLVDPELDTVQVFRPSADGQAHSRARTLGRGRPDADYAPPARLRHRPARAVPRVVAQLLAAALLG